METEHQDSAGSPPATPTALAPAAAAPPAATSAPAGETFTVSRTTFNYVVIAFVFLIIGLVAGGLLFGRGSGLDQAALTRIVQAAVAQGGGGGAPLLMSDRDPALGPADAPVTLIEFSDFNCPFCSRHALETLPRLIDHYGDKLRLVYRDYPVIGGESSRVAALAANCAHEQDKFWEFHGLLFSNTAARDRAAYLGFAQELSMNVDRFTECLDTERYASEINLDYIDGQGQAISGTPAFFINGARISGAQPFDIFADVIDRELTRAGITPPARPARGG